MDTVLKLQFSQLVAAYIFVVLVLVIVRRKGIPREKEILIATIRMTLQLVLTGYVLVYVFGSPSPMITLVILSAMEIFAVHNIIQRTKILLPFRLKRIIAFSMITGTVSCLLYFLLIVVGINPWYDPQYFIPLAGMLIGNSMTGISLGVGNLLEGMTSKKHLVEGALMLGATPKMATKEIVNNAFDSAILPTINSMVGMGIIFLPGMMTGQILSGTSPVTAIGYQIAIMMGILGSVSITVILFLHLGYRSFFNEQSQFVELEEATK
ncbi:iron export ABC transporter permease subunit FetB [Alkalibacter rhizosphaerae]|uniref:Iron export ABC transporter permease subunit FetB n=1 Tax=Alkalibacter rhizosphaerae TaxID=2815577 RepID=A0A975AIG2_9FIRM|nr:iron export ABC transporter permease subunit FetB [Alkalibacter rhizosphaerae]QSX09442.1 iron export ABC transporter permease subunit FetB [Alkalibacter rhizosphaerae]